MTTVEHVVLTSESRRKLRKVKYWSFGTVADSIECANSWSIPEDITEYVDLRDKLEESFAKFFELKNRDDVHIKNFQANILSFHKGVYPDFTPEPKRKTPAKKRPKPGTKASKGTGRAKNAKG